MYGTANPGISLADIAAVTRNGNCNDGFGGGNGWWVLVILWALWGNNGWGNGRNGNGCCDNGCGSGSGSSVTYNVGAEMQRGFDTQAIVQKLDGLNSGLCSLGYDQLAQMNGITSTVQQTGFNIIQALNQMGIHDMQSFNQVIAAIQACCCGTKEQICDLKYTGAKNATEIINAITQAAQSIVQNDNNNYRQLHDEIIGNRMQDMRDQLAQKDTLINMMNLQGSQTAQTADIVNQILARLRDCPIGTYNVCNPNCCNNTQFPTLQQIVQALGNGCGCNPNPCC